MKFVWLTELTPIGCSPEPRFMFAKSDQRHLKHNPDERGTTLVRPTM